MMAVDARSERKEKQRYTTFALTDPKQATRTYTLKAGLRVQGSLSDYSETSPSKTKKSCATITLLIKYCNKSNLHRCRIFQNRKIESKSVAGRKEHMGLNSSY